MTMYQNDQERQFDTDTLNMFSPYCSISQERAVTVFVEKEPLARGHAIHVYKGVRWEETSLTLHPDQPPLVRRELLILIDATNGRYLGYRLPQAAASRQQQCQHGRRCAARGQHRAQNGPSTQP